MSISQTPSRLSIVSFAFFSLLISVNFLSAQDNSGFVYVLDSPDAARSVRLVPVSGATNTDVFAEIELEAQGNEVGFQTSVHFNPAVVSVSSVSGVSANPDIILGSGAPAGTTLNVNGAGAGSGDIGIAANFNGANTNPSTVVPAGTKRIIRIKFHILANAAQGSSPVTFTNNVISRFLFDANGFVIAAPPYIDGSVTVTAGGPAPTPTPTPSPTPTPTPSPTPTPGPSPTPTPSPTPAPSPTPTPGSRTLTIGSASGAQFGSATIPVTLTATGGEYGVSLTVNWDPALLSITGVAGSDVLPGSTALPVGCMTTINSSGVTLGRLGLSVGCPNGGIPAGNDEILKLKFGVKAGATVGMQIPVIFGNTPINTEIGDSNGNTLTVAKVTGAITVLAPPVPVTISGRVTTPSASGVRNARVTLMDSTGVLRSTTTSSFGFYEFDGVNTGSSYTLTVTSRSFRFGSRSITPTDNMFNLDFIGLE